MQAALTSGSMLLEEMVSTKNPQVKGHNNIYATNNGATFFEMESLAGQEDKVTTMEIIGYIVFVLIVLLLFIPCIHAILRIKRTYGQDTGSFNLDRSPKKVDGGHGRVTYNTGLPEVVESTSPSMERTFEELNSDNNLNPVRPTVDLTVEEAVKKARENLSAIDSMKKLCVFKPPS